MELRNLRTFLLAAELSSFTRAAQELNYVQSTVTMQIQQLERELGFPLFDRIGKRVSLTPPGSEFLSCAREILALFQHARELGRGGPDLRGTLRVGVLESLLSGRLTALLPALRTQFPGLELRLKMGDAADLLPLLKQNRLDLVYLLEDPIDDPELCRRSCRPEQVVFVSSPGHPLAGRRQVSVRELLACEFLVTERSGGCYRLLRKLAAAHGLMLNAPLEADSTAVIAELAQQGMGLAFLPEYSVAAQLRAGTLVRLDAALPPQVYYSQLLYHSGRWVSPFLEGFIRLAEAQSPDAPR